MGNFKEKIARFMNGRYGIDQLYYAFIVTYLVLLVANTFISSVIISTLMWGVLVLMTFRIFSKNILKRRMENKQFMKVWNRVKAKFSLTTRRIKESKTHRFRKCPHCKKVLRLPKRMGKHTVKCPCCHKEFELNVRF